LERRVKEKKKRSLKNHKSKKRILRGGWKARGIVPGGETKGSTWGGESWGGKSNLLKELKKKKSTLDGHERRRKRPP